MTYINTDLIGVQNAVYSKYYQQKSDMKLIVFCRAGGDIKFPY